jgi:hypothetical protein
MQRFRQAVEANDLDAVEACLADDVVFKSPLVFKPYVGRQQVGLVLRAVATVFQDFRYVGELGGSDGQSALLFTARVGERELEGIDLLRSDERGQVTQLTVMVRPLSAALALGEAMRKKLGLE